MPHGNETALQALYITYFALHVPNVATTPAHAGTRRSTLNVSVRTTLIPRCASADTLKHFGCELGAQTNFNQETGISIVNGAHTADKLSEVLEIFIKKYVQCYGCGNPETVVKVRKGLIHLKCKACGHTSDVDMRDKLTTYILKNPPENKLSKSEEKVKKAEKERMRAAEKEARKAEKAEAKEKEGKRKKKEKRCLSPLFCSPPSFSLCVGVGAVFSASGWCGFCSVALCSGKLRYGGCACCHTDCRRAHHFAALHCLRVPSVGAGH